MHFDFNIRKDTHHTRNTFITYKSLLYYLSQNSKKEIFITRDQVDDFFVDGDKLVINLKEYQRFCDCIGKNGQNRAQAFFSRKLRDYTEDEKKAIIQNASTDEIIKRINLFSVAQKKAFLAKLRSIEDLKSPEQDIRHVSDEEFITGFDSLLKSPRRKALLISKYPSVQLSALKDHKEFLENSLDKNEKFIQDWIDGKISNQGDILVDISNEERERIQRSRCLIFGLEFIDHKREGQLSSKRFDILARLSEEEGQYVLIELKSPDADFFKIEVADNKNGGKSEEYRLSPDISRAIPQILRYRDNLESKPPEDEDWRRIGLPKQKISKCIILIGQAKNDPVWEGHFLSIRKSFSSSLEIMTYTDLIRKLDVTIKNLEKNLL